jgi:hypothetical protein
METGRVCAKQNNASPASRVRRGVRRVPTEGVRIPAADDRVTVVAPVQIARDREEPWIVLLQSIPATPDGHLPVADFYRAIAESLTVGFVSFGLLAAAWMLVAVGVVRRHATSLP